MHKKNTVLGLYYSVCSALYSKQASALAEYPVQRWIKGLWMCSFRALRSLRKYLLHAPPRVCNIFGCWGWKWPQALHPAESLQGPPYLWLLHHLIHIDISCALSPFLFFSHCSSVDQKKHIDQPRIGTKPVLHYFTPPCSDLCCAPYT